MIPDPSGSSTDVSATPRWVGAVHRPKRLREASSSGVRASQRPRERDPRATRARRAGRTTHMGRRTTTSMPVRAQWPNSGTGRSTTAGRLGPSLEWCGSLRPPIGERRLRRTLRTGNPPCRRSTAPRRTPYRSRRRRRALPSQASRSASSVGRAVRPPWLRSRRSSVGPSPVRARRPPRTRPTVRRFAVSATSLR